jgi:hypothetical protein
MIWSGIGNDDDPQGSVRGSWCIACFCSVQTTISGTDGRLTLTACIGTRSVPMHLGRPG